MFDNHVLEYKKYKLKLYKKAWNERNKDKKAATTKKWYAKQDKNILKQKAHEKYLKRKV